MEDSETKIKQQLVTAAELFAANKYAQCRKVLAEVKMAHPSIDLDQFITEYKQSPAKASAVIKKVLDALAALRPDPAAKRSRINYELHYWNAVVLAQQLGKGQVAQLALQFAESLRTETSLMLLYQLLSAREKAGRLASSLALIEKLQRLLDRAKELTQTEQAYRFLNQVLFNRVLLKLGIIEGSKIMFMMRFNQAPESKQELELSQINGINLSIYQQFLHAEIEYHSGSYAQAIKILSQLIPQLDSLGKNRELVKAMIDHNMAIILTNYQKSSSAQFLLRKSLKYLSSTEELQYHNERHSLLSKCRQNMLLTGVINQKAPASSLYEYMKGCDASNSYKHCYRKAQACINYYHQLLAQPQRVLPNKEVHDSYDPVYYYPNQPYFQQKGKNKNPNFTAGRAYHRRYVMPEWESCTGDPSVTLPREVEPVVQKEKEKKKEKPTVIGKNGKAVKKEEELPKQPQVNAPIQDPHKAKLNEALTLAEGYLKQALILIEKERNVVVSLQGEEKGLSQQINEKLHCEYVEYKCSLYCLLCYVQLSQRQWIEALLTADGYLHFAQLHQLDSRSPQHQRTYFSILTYRMEALCELGRMPTAYEAMQDAASIVNYAEEAQLQARSTANQQAGQSYLEMMSQYSNFCFNVAVLHSHDNKIPEAFQAIQKVLQQLRMVPSSPQARLPLSAIELLTHYNLRTGNSPSALQLIKRRRILSVPGALSHHPPTLSITK